MSDSQTIFECTNCGAQFQKWTGRCLECGKWGTVSKNQESKKTKKQNENTSAPTKTVKLSDIAGQNTARITTRVGELDRVLGGGLVPGSLILLGGEPGIGKSTLALQLASAIENTLYLSAEESVEQIKLRADRLGIKSSTLKLGNEDSVETIIATIFEAGPLPALSPSSEGLRSVEARVETTATTATPLPSPSQRGGLGRGLAHSLAIIDSVQTIYSEEVEGEPGSISQIRASTVKLLEAAKSSGTAIVLVSHVTKEGVVAGPKTLEHLVDTVLYLEGDRHHFYRILRTVKNRFGSTDEVGIFEMKANGLVEVKNPSQAFLAERGDNLPGNVLTCLMEGTRPILVEVQALVTKTAFGYPVRKASGFDINRLHLLIAVLQKRAGLNLEQYDVHLNIVGGLTADEPAADLAVAIAIASAYKDKPLGADLAVFGEVGLSGEVRTVAQADRRIKECEQLGLKRVITSLTKQAPATSKLKTITIKNLQEIIKHT